MTEASPSVGRSTCPTWTSADWTALVARGTRYSYPAGTPILHQGDSGNWVAALVAGRAKVLYAGPDGAEILLAVRGPGDVVGEFAHGDRGTRSASVQAMEHCVVSLVPDARFAEWISARHLGQKVNHYVLAKARESAVHTWRLAHCRPARRLASLLITVVAAGGDDARTAFTVPMSQDELARAIGLARSSITPILADWKRTGIVAIDRSHTVVLGESSLRRLQKIATAPL